MGVTGIENGHHEQNNLISLVLPVLPVLLYAVPKSLLMIVSILRRRLSYPYRDTLTTLPYIVVLMREGPHVSAGFFSWGRCGIQAEAVILRNSRAG
jgi:hypothetical protein